MIPAGKQIQLLGITLLLSLIFNISYSQKAYHSPAGIYVQTNDTVVMRLKDFKGELIQWQYSDDGLQWTDLVNQTTDTLMIIAGQSQFYRAQVFAGDCDPFYSDTTKILTYKTTENVLIEADYGLSLISVEAESGNLLYKGDISPLLKEGTTLVGSDGEGYIKVVTGWKLTDENTEVYTRQGTLRDVFREIDLQDQITILFSDDKSSLDIGTREIPVKSTLFLKGDNAKNNLVIDLSGIEFIFELTGVNPKETGNAIVKITEGGLLFQPRINQNLQIKSDESGISSYYVTQDDHIRFVFDAIAESNIRTELLKQTLPLVNLRIGPLAIGPVKTFIDYTVEIRFEGFFDEPGAYRFGYDGQYFGYVGAYYNPQQDPIWKHGSSIDGIFGLREFGTDIEKYTTGKISVESKTKLIVAGVELSEISLAPSLSVDIENKAIELTAGMNSHIDVNSKILDHSIPDFQHKFPEKTWIIKSAKDSILDIDGNAYSSVFIGLQEWLSKDLRVTRYNNYEPIPFGLNVMDQDSYGITYYQHIEDLENNQQAINAYGYVYNWYAATDSRGICPAGWQVPSDENWDELIEYLRKRYVSSGKIIIGNVLKSCRQQGSPLEGDCNINVHPRWDFNGHDYGTDNYGFSALPAYMPGTRASWWSINERPADFNTTYGNAVMLSYDFGGIDRVGSIKYMGRSIRCFRPTGARIPTLRTSNVVNITQHHATGEGEITDNGMSEIISRGLIWSTLQYPTIEQNEGIMTSSGGVGLYSILVTGLSAGTTYHIRAFATNEAGTGYGQQISFSTVRDDENPLNILTDIDGYKYATVVIGNQEWMAENLRVTRTNNGTPVSMLCYNNDPNLCKAYGGLYNWETIMNGETASYENPSGVQGICPAGWHVPSTAEWAELEQYLIENYYYITTNNVGNMLKSCRQHESSIGGCITSEHPRWNAHSTHFGTDRFGFSALPGGFRHALDYMGLGNVGVWTTSSKNPVKIVTADQGRIITYPERSTDLPVHTFRSVRCVRGTVVNYPACPGKVTFIYNGEKVTYGMSEGQGGRCWLDRNLGASRVASSLNDEEAFGDLFQWGRADDGHQQRSSDTTTVLSNTDTPGHNKFIVTSEHPFDWKDTQSNSLWAGYAGINDPCPVGWRIPTMEEMENERKSWNTNDFNGAFESPLRLPASGRRDFDGNINVIYAQGSYWTSSTIGQKAYNLYIYTGNTDIKEEMRVQGSSIRCIKN